jgi:tellurite resistance protein TerC
MFVTTEVLWGVFIGIVVVMLILDLGVFHRDSHVIKTREAYIWTGVIYPVCEGA